MIFGWSELLQSPHCGTSGSDGGWSADLVASGELWINHLPSLMGKVGAELLERVSAPEDHREVIEKGEKFIAGLR